MKTIIFTINDSGEVTEETKGFIGKSCQDATKAYEKALGEVENEELTPEYYNREQNRVQER